MPKSPILRERGAVLTVHFLMFQYKSQVYSNRDFAALSHADSSLLRALHAYIHRLDTSLIPAWSPGACSRPARRSNKILLLYALLAIGCAAVFQNRGKIPCA